MKQHAIKHERAQGFDYYMKIVNNHWRDNVLL